MVVRPLETSSSSSDSTDDDSIVFDPPLVPQLLKAKRESWKSSMKFRKDSTITMFSKIFGGGKNQAPAPTTQESIQQLREAEEMLYRRKVFVPACHVAPPPQPLRFYPKITIEMAVMAARQQRTLKSLKKRAERCEREIAHMRDGSRQVQ
uniref:TPX2 domain-containing protein n=1 Tax=Steinernema glaseri TaxID=37863 RepID=A0A1I7ZUJ0_9BILA